VTTSADYTRLPLGDAVKTEVVWLADRGAFFAMFLDGPVVDVMTVPAPGFFS